MKSIISNAKECFVCHTTMNLHKHHIIHGANNRNKSEHYGLWVNLCVDNHTGKWGVHSGNVKLDQELCRIGQEAFEKHFPDEDFMKVFHRNFK